MNNEEIIQRINELREKRGKNLKSSNENVCETDANADLNIDVAVNLAEFSRKIRRRFGRKFKPKTELQALRRYFKGWAIDQRRRSPRSTQ